MGESKKVSRWVFWTTLSILIFSFITSVTFSELKEETLVIAFGAVFFFGLVWFIGYIIGWKHSVRSVFFNDEESSVSGIPSELLPPSDNRVSFTELMVYFLVSGAFLLGFAIAEEYKSTILAGLFFLIAVIFVIILLIRALIGIMRRRAPPSK